jgi:uncharacterized circularly permuted ATP-grasp superfamily protein/uncharacterized alpha-E superfamily protein
MSQVMGRLESQSERLFSTYKPPAGTYDEVAGADGPRAAWREFVDRMEAGGVQGLGLQSEQVRRLMRESGLSYSFHRPSHESDAQWELDPIPWLLSKAEWMELAASMSQRARLLNRILADLYGPQELISSGLVPAELVFSHPGFLIPCHGMEMPESIYLHLYGAKLARGPDGGWLVLADRTQSPSGPGLAVQNRIVLSRTLSTDFHRLRVERLASVFIALRRTLQSLAPHHRDNPRIVLLSSGPRASTYFEDAYLARYLGYTLAEGGDLTVRGTNVYLKTLGGLLPVDAILRRQPDDLCDPLELKGNSASGIPGLVQAARHKQVLVANALGSGFLETPALLTYLPAICRRLLGEDLRLPSVPTRWCGKAEDWRYVQSHFDDLVIRPAVFRRGEQAINTAEMARDERADLFEKIRSRPADYVAQERVTSSVAPAWGQGSLQAWHVSLKTYAVADLEGGYQVMPGGLARVAPPTSVSEMTSSVPLAKDVWVLSDGPVAPVTLLQPPTASLGLRRSGNDLPSRVADNLYWLGRYVERAEEMVRQARGCLSRMTSEFEWSNLPELPALVRSLTADIATSKPPVCFARGGGNLEEEVVSFLIEPSHSNAFHETLRTMYRIAAAVRDRVSLDAWRIVNQIDIEVLLPRSKERVRLGDILTLLDQLLNLLSALSGLGMESMTRGPGWRFLDMGRRMERSLYTLRLLRHMLVRCPGDPMPFLEAILEVADSSMTYRYRYLTSILFAPVLDLLLIDETNPRSVGFQVTVLSDHVRELPNKDSDLLRNHETRLALAIQTALRLADVEPLTEMDDLGVHGRLDAFLEKMIQQLVALSDSITHTYFTHTGPSRPLGT